MLTVDDFKKRAKALWQSQQRMAAPKKWKSGKRAGQIRREAIPIHFTEYEFGKWLWDKVGLNAIPCPYCRKPIDVLSLTVDHITPRALDGQFALSNMECICPECNERKGKFSPQGFVALLQFSRTLMTTYDRDVLLTRLRKAAAAYGGYRTKGGGPAAPAKPKPQPGIFELPEF